MCTTFLLGHWQPLSWLSCALDYQAWGLNSQGWHATNLLIHAVNAVLVYGLCLAFGRRTHPALTGTPPSEGICKTQGITLMAGDPHHDRGGHPCCLIQSPPLEGCPKGGVGCYAVAALAALFWAVHPLRVEAVAWLSTRGYLLCTTFCLLTVLFYFREVGTVRRTVRGRLGEASLPNRYPLAALLCFTLATCTKGIGMMLPFVLLLIDWQWAKSREQGAGREERGLLRKKVVEKIPFFALSLVTGITAFLAKKADGGMVSLESHSLWTRIGQAVYCFWFYIWKTVAPEGLSPLYYRLPNSVVSSALLLAALLLFLLAFLWRRRHPWFLLVLAAYVLLIFPMLGITQSGLQVAADRFTYLSTLPFAVLIACALVHLQVFRRTCFFLSGILISLFCIQSVNQTLIWQNDMTLWQYVLRRSPLNLEANQNLAAASLQLQSPEEGVSALRRALDYASRAGNVEAEALSYNSLGLIYSKIGQPDEALKAYGCAIALDPSSMGGSFALHNRALLYHATGRSKKALDDLDAALKNPKLKQLDRAERLLLRAKIRMETGDRVGAEADCEAIPPEVRSKITERLWLKSRE